MHKKLKSKKFQKGCDVMKFLLYSIFIVLYLLVTFFGIGPVLFADGSTQERMITLAIVVIIYIGLTLVLRLLIKKISR